MFDFLTSNFKRGARQIRENPQLSYTLVTAAIIFLAFLFASNNFLLIARDAQERLVNVRIGSIHDVFSEFTPEYIDNPESLSEKITEISRKNETIHDFRIIVFQNGKRLVIASLDDNEIGSFDENNDFLYNLSSAEVGYSFTAEETINGIRFFKTARAITDSEGIVIGSIYTKQSLSQADKMVSRGIRNGIVILVAVLVMVMMLFFRHAKVIDYTVLYRRLKDINKIKDDFISIATHELRTPLTVIRGYVDLLKSSKNADSEDRKLIENIDMHSKRLSLLIDDILSVPKIEQGKMDFHMEKFDPAKEVMETTRSLKHSAEEKGLKISCQIEDSAFIVADRNKLRQVLVNIIGNAIKYTKEGKVDVKLSIKDDNLNIRVSDTGIGMSAEEQKGLFQKFYRIRSRDTEDITGTGLGLWITLKLLEAMNGEISVESIKGVGTHVILTFPAIKSND